MLSEYEASVLMKDLASKRSRHFYSQRTIIIAVLLVIAATAWRQPPNPMRPRVSTLPHRCAPPRPATQPRDWRGRTRTPESVSSALSNSIGTRNSGQCAGIGSWPLSYASAMWRPPLRHRREGNDTGHPWRPCIRGVGRCAPRGCRRIGSSLLNAKVSDGFGPSDLERHVAWPQPAQRHLRRCLQRIAGRIAAGFSPLRRKPFGGFIGSQSAARTGTVGFEREIR